MLAIRRLAAVPQAGAAVDALFAFKSGHAVRALGKSLAGAHGDAGLLKAGRAECGRAEDDVIGETGHGLDLAANQ